MPRMSRTTASLLSRTGFGLAVAALAVPASGQQLWSVEEVTTRPIPPIEVGGVAAAPQAASVGGPLTAEAATVQVEFDYLRLGMGFLELPLLDGSVIEAENAVFEDRGDGNLMWTGEVPGAGYESVLFTVQDGHLVGWFGEPGGPKYTVHAGPDGRGSLAVEAGPAGDWCGVGKSRDAGPVGASAAVSDSLGSVTAATSPNSLDILTLYTQGTARYWRVIGGAAVGIQQLADYFNMVLRNGAIKATANLIPARWDPVISSHPGTQGWHYQDRGLRGGTPWHWEFASSAVVDRFRRRHGPDLIHLIPDVGARNTAGEANLRGSLEPYVNTGWSTPNPSTFAHEVGHNLGGHHEPITFGDRFAELQSEWWRPYVFGHTDLTSCAKRQGGSDLLICPSTVMSYGQDTWGDPKRFAVTEPFYSSVRHKPNGWTIGVADTSEVERVFHDTVPVVAVSGDVPWNAEQYPRRVVDARWTDHDTVRVTWSGDWRSKNGGTVRLALAAGTNDFYRWNWDFKSGPSDRLDAEYSDENVKPALSRDGTQVGVDIAGLRPGGRYRIAVQGPSRLDPDSQTVTLSRSSDAFHLKARGRVSGSPAAATELGARVTGPDSVRLHWRDNSRVETDYEVWYRKWSGDEPDEVWSLYGALPARSRYVDVEGLAAEEEIQVTDGYYDSKKRAWIEGQKAKRGRYSFVVVAHNDEGWSASETFDLEFLPGPYPEPTAFGEVTDCYEGNRPTGVDLDGYQVYACLETPDGARRRAWDYGLEADQSALLYFFGRDNAEILVKVLDGCGVNGYRWVFVAPVTDLPFKLMIREVGPYVENRRRRWQYDSRRRPQTRYGDSSFGNPRGRTARTVSDTTAFPCTTAEIAAAQAGAASSAADSELDSVDLAEPSSPTRLSAGARTDCEPGGPALTLRGGYTVSMCYETGDGRVGNARDWGLDSSQSGLLYFFDPDNVEVLIKVLDGCGVNGHRWVFVAPVTDLAFNLHVEGHNGRRWSHTNRLGQTADTAADVTAFVCADDDAITVSVDPASAEEGDAVEFAVTLSAPAASDTVLTWRTADGTATAGEDFTAVTAGMLRISAGETTGTLRVATTEDAIAEDDETFGVTLSGTTLPPGVILIADQAIGTIVDDEEPVEIALSEAGSADEGDAVEFTVTLSAPAGGDAVLGWSTSDGTATAGEDFSAVTAGMLRISAGETTGTLRVATTEDAIAEPDETFGVTLSATTLPSGVVLVADHATGTIVDDDWEPIAIPDANLRRAVADALGLTEGTPITQPRLDRLTRLTAKEAGISDLKGLEFAVNLTYLHLFRNNVVDASPLAGLTSLTFLELGSNAIRDVSPLAGLTNLTTLWLGSNAIEDVSPLAGLTGLTWLALGDNAIEDVSALAGMTNLTTLLDLASNAIEDVSPLARLTNLKSLSLWNNVIEDVSPLSGLTNLKTLHLWDNAIEDVSPLAGLTNLTTLWLGSNVIEDVSPLAGLTNLTTLSLGYNNAIEDVSPLAGLVDLTRLDLARNQIEDVSPLAGLTDLTWLGLAYNVIEDVAPLLDLANLEEVDLNCNPLSSVSVAEHVPALQGRGVKVLFDTTCASVSVSDLTVAAGVPAETIPLAGVLRALVDTELELCRRRSPDPLALRRGGAA